MELRASATNLARLVATRAEATMFHYNPKTFGRRFTVWNLKDPTKLNKFLSRFASLWDVNNPPTTTASADALIAQPLAAGIGADVLATLQNLKLGGH